MTSSHSSVDPFAMPMMFRTRFESTSAPPPGMESRPAVHVGPQLASEVAGAFSAGMGGTVCVQQ